MEHMESDGHVGSFIAKITSLSSIQAPNSIKRMYELKMGELIVNSYLAAGMCKVNGNEAHAKVQCIFL